MNKTITLICQFKSEVGGLEFHLPQKPCNMQNCIKPDCADTLSCFDNNTFEITVKAQASWNNKTLQCGFPFGGIKSNPINMTVKGRIKHMCTGGGFNLHSVLWKKITS